VPEPAVPATAGRPGRRPWAAVAALCLIQFVDVLCVTVIVTTLPRMLADVDAAAADSTLIATAYAMFFGGLLMFGARLGDRIGHRRCILVSLAVFAGGALLAATAGSALALTVARCVQGAAAAGAVPAALRLLTSLPTGGPTRNRAVAAWSAAGAAAGASGYVVGGVVTDVGSWRLIFWGLVGLSVLQAVAILTLVPAGPPLARQPVNVIGSGLFTAAIMLVVVGTALLGDHRHRVLGGLLLGAAVVVLGGFGAADRRSAAPLLPRSVLALPQLSRGTAGAFINTATTSSAATLLTLYLQGGLGRTPLAAAATLLPLSLFVIVGSVAAGRLGDRLSAERVTAAGLLLIGVGIGLLIVRPAVAVLVSVSVAVVGFGLGLASVASTALATDVPEQPRATASGIVNTGAQLGTAIGTAVILLVATATTGVPGGSDRVPYVGWAAGAALALGAAVVFTRLRQPAKRRTAAETSGLSPG